MIRHNGPISGVATSEKFVATAGYDNHVILWEAGSRTALARGLHDHLANRCEISPSQKFLVSASSDYSARVWKLPEMQLHSVLLAHTDDVEMARFSPCESMIATTSQDGGVRIFTLDGTLKHHFVGHAGASSSCAWSADGARVVSSGDDGFIRTWNLAAGDQENALRPEDVQTDAVVMTSGGAVFAGNDLGELLRIENKRVEKVLVHESGIKNLILNREETLAVTMSYDRHLAVIDLRDLSIKRKVKMPAAVWARACAFHGSDTLIFGTFGSTYATLNLITEEWDHSKVEGTDCLNALIVRPHSVYSVGDSGQVRRAEREFASDTLRPVTVVAEMGSLCNFIVPWGDRVVCGGHLGQIFDAHTGAVLLSLSTPLNKALQVGPYLIVATYTGELVVCVNGSDGRMEIFSRHKILANAIKDLCADGDRVFCVGAAADMAYFDFETFSLAGRIEKAHDNIINSCAALGGGRFVTVSRDLRLKVWRGLELDYSVLSPHDHSVKCVAVSADRRFIAAGSYDGKIAIFDEPSRRWCILRRLSSAGISSVVFDRGSFWASSYDGLIYRVDPPC